MLGLGNTKYDESIREIPSDDSYPMVSILFSKDNGIDVNALSLTVLDLKGITLRIANKGELKTSESAAINLLKNLNKGKKFNLKAMAKQTNNHSIANKFEKDFNDKLHRHP